MSGKIGPVRNACRECAGPEVKASSRICASREYIEVGKFAQSEKGRESEERYTRAIRLLNNQGTTAMIESFGQIHFLKWTIVDVLVPSYVSDLFKSLILMVMFPFAE